MNKRKKPLMPKVEIRGEGLGVPSANEIEIRAREIAVIDGRTAVTDEDREEATAEFQNRALPDALTEDADNAPSMSRDPSEPLSDRGRQTRERGGEDEETAVEKLTLEGVEEAQHEQMVESRKTVDEPSRSRMRSDE
jgi:hypothetical protein